ncbi:MAG: hypothetical protein ACXVA4_07420, partial [Ktedonobacterales bacterium]
MRHHGRQHRRAQRSGIQSLPVVISLGLMATALLALAACGGATSPSGSFHTPLPTRPIPTGQETRPPTAGESTPPPQVSYAYLYSRIDYPLQIKVD